MMWLLVAVAVPVVYVACRDLRANFRSDSPDVWRADLHGRARTASLAGAVTAPLLYSVSDVMAVVFAVASVALFWLVPNRMLTTQSNRAKANRAKANRAKTKRRKGRG